MVQTHYTWCVSKCSHTTCASLRYRGWLLTPLAQSTDSPPKHGAKCTQCKAFTGKSNSPPDCLGLHRVAIRPIRTRDTTIPRRIGCRIRWDGSRERHLPSWTEKSCFGQYKNRKNTIKQRNRPTNDSKLCASSLRIRCRRDPASICSGYRVINVLVSKWPRMAVFGKKLVKMVVNTKCNEWMWFARVSRVCGNQDRANRSIFDEAAVIHSYGSRWHIYIPLRSYTVFSLISALGPWIFGHVQPPRFAWNSIFEAQFSGLSAPILWLKQSLALSAGWEGANQTYEG